MKYHHTLIHRKELEEQAKEMGLSLEDAAREIVKQHYIEHRTLPETAELISKKDLDDVFYVFDVIIKENEYIEKHGATQPISLFTKDCGSV